MSLTKWYIRKYQQLPSESKNINTNCCLGCYESGNDCYGCARDLDHKYSLCIKITTLIFGLAFVSAGIPLHNKPLWIGGLIMIVAGIFQLVIVRWLCYFSREDQEQYLEEVRVIGKN
jgi:hypothetical protein